ncbi:MAG: LysR family transcriptional regulator [Rhodospirillales bacterium]|jgi:LysR family transcriptional regulator, glycine cleavage system transcriptional activator|nr:LysR family transcriptional regulator [Rhodospirillales bacterium]MBT4039002.1 LysR family transcriptional regulator [Rhodospirillales bacterium]MBT4628172.1 LysR family transcriptional regulator [Rhodospirillales bacterium]MBT5353450.1 LysR family transcriptional regulator [Rhodospirillales bacterium]MBT5522150.1 LysR family transcriptional regulator [Rhodospirillales bacterium]
MSKRPYDIPSLTALAAFEASARNLSFKLAAVELNVTAPAISRQIKLLEQDLGCTLFYRRHRQVQLTPDGMVLFEALAESFTTIAGAAQAVRTTSSGQVRVGTTNAFVSLWLMPRLQDFWRRYPDVRLHHNISDEAINVTASGSDVTIRFGAGQWAGMDSQYLFGDRIYAACSPAYAERNGPLVDAEQLADHTLLEITNISAEDWAGWPDWFRAVGVSTRARELRYFDSYGVAVQAAIDGLGIVMGWHSLIGPAVTDGKLVQILPHIMTPDNAFYMVTRQHRPLSAEAKTFADWLQEQAARYCSKVTD